MLYCPSITSRMLPPFSPGGCDVLDFQTGFQVLTRRTRGQFSTCPFVVSWCFWIWFYTVPSLQGWLSAAVWWTQWWHHRTVSVFLYEPDRQISVLSLRRLRVLWMTYSVSEWCLLCIFTSERLSGGSFLYVIMSLTRCQSAPVILGCPPEPIPFSICYCPTFFSNVAANSVSTFDTFHCFLFFSLIMGCQCSANHRCLFLFTHQTMSRLFGSRVLHYTSRTFSQVCMSEYLPIKNILESMDQTKTCSLTNLWTAAGVQVAPHCSSELNFPHW